MKRILQKGKKKKKVYEGNFKFPKLRSWPTKIRKEKRRKKKKKKKKRAILKNVIFINKYFNIRSCFNFSTTLSKDLSIKITVISWILRAKVGIKNGKVSSYYYDGNYTFFFSVFVFVSVSSHLCYRLLFATIWEINGRLVTVIQEHKHLTKLQIISFEFVELSNLAHKFCFCNFSP